MRMIGPLVSIFALVFVLATSIFVATMVSDAVFVCDEKNLQTREVIITNKFVENKGFEGDSYYFLDENGVDYQIWGGHEGARYVKLKMNQSYQIKVSIKIRNASCEEVLI